jgi:hypothetical protein
LEELEAQARQKRAGAWATTPETKKATDGK